MAWTTGFKSVAGERRDGSLKLFDDLAGSRLDRNPAGGESAATVESAEGMVRNVLSM
jgi:hypothetical protein